MTRALAVLGAVWIGGLATRSLPHDQLLIFPVGSVFPSATRFGASWTRIDEREPRGGITLSFRAPPPLQIREKTNLPNGDYIVSIEILLATASNWETGIGKVQNMPSDQSLANAQGVQTKIERRVTLSGGETLIALAAGGF